MWRKGKSSKPGQQSRRSAMKRSTLIEILHPDGRTSSAQVIGSNCPAILLPERQNEAREETDLVILAPSAAECSRAGWLREAVLCMSGQLAADGVGYVLAPRRWRLKITRLLQEVGLLLEASFGHLPSWSTSHYLVPFAPAPIGYAFSTLIPTPTWKRHLTKQWFRLPGAGWLLAYLWPSAGLTVRRPGARPLFEWLYRSAGEDSRPGNALARMSWRGPEGGIVLYSFPPGAARPTALAKVTMAAGASEGGAREADILARLGPGAERAGARVPQILGQKQEERGAALFQTVVDGRPAAELLRSQPDQLSPLVTKVVDWLERWHGATVVLRQVNFEQLDRTFFKPAALLAPFRESGEAYQVWLTQRCKEVFTVPVPCVATHNDLTMANVLFDDLGRLGIVDWETGQPEGWPLVDFVYALTDAVMIAGDMASRLEAFKTCFEPGGFYTSLAANWQARLVAACGISAELAEICLHACWLHHAVNEYHVSQAAEPRPFLQIVQWLSLHPSFSERKRE